MKIISKKRDNEIWLGLILGLMIFLLAAGVRTRAAEEGVPYCAPNVTLYFSSYSTGSMISPSYIYVGNLSSKAVITNVKSSNKKIVADPLDKSINVYTKSKMVGGKIKGSFLKNGEKSLISFTVKQGKTEYNLQCNVTFKKDVANPLKSIKIGGKNNTKFKKAAGDFIVSGKKGKSSKVKIKVKMKPGYNLVSIRAGYWKKGWAKEEPVKIKNGGEASLKYLGADLVSVYVDYYREEDRQGIATKKDMKRTGMRSEWYRISFK